MWMAVHGSIGLPLTLVTHFKLICYPDRKRKEKGIEVTDFENESSLMNLYARLIGTLFNLFLFIWLIIGSVWVLSKYDDWDDAGRPTCNGLPSDSNKCCHEGMFLFAFIFIIISWCIILLVFCYKSRFMHMCYSLIVYACRRCQRNKQQQTTREASEQA